MLVVLHFRRLRVMRRLMIGCRSMMVSVRVICGRGRLVVHDAYPPYASDTQGGI
jgi:hypothetical protein